MTNSKKIFDSWLVLESQAGSKKAMSLLVKDGIRNYADIPAGIQEILTKRRM
jgi:hypothetical protein